MRTSARHDRRIHASTIRHTASSGTSVPPSTAQPGSAAPSRMAPAAGPLKPSRIATAAKITMTQMGNRVGWPFVDYGAEEFTTQSTEHTEENRCLKRMIHPPCSPCPPW